MTPQHTPRRVNAVTSTHYVVFLLACVLVAMCSASVPNLDYVIEIQVYVDQIGFDQWMKQTGKTSWQDLEGDIRSIIVEARAPFSSMSKMNPPLKMYLEIVDITLLTKEQFEFSTVSVKGKKVLPHLTAIDELRSWLERNSEHYKMAIMFTGHDIAHESSAEGLPFYYSKDTWKSHTNSMCRAHAIGLMELNNNNNDGFIAERVAQMIAKTLTPYTGRTLPDCYDSGKDYIKYDHDNPMQFSECLYKSIMSSYEDIETWGCLVLGDELYDNIPALNINADALCRREDQMSRAAYKTGYGNKFCQQIKCIRYRKGSTREYALHEDNLPRDLEYGILRNHRRTSYAPYGLSCGKNKLCYKGKCVMSANGDPNVSDSCPHGDQDLIKLGYKFSCQDVTDCAKFKHLCCQSCNKD